MDQLKAYSRSMTAPKDIHQSNRLVQGSHSNFEASQSSTAVQSGALERWMVLLTFALSLMGLLLLINMQLKIYEPFSALENRIPPKAPYAFTIRSHLVFLLSGAAEWATLFT